MHLSSCTYEIYINLEASSSYKLKLLCSNHKMTSDVPTGWSCISLSYAIIWQQIDASASSYWLLVHRLLLAWREYNGNILPTEWSEWSIILSKHLSKVLPLTALPCPVLTCPWQIYVMLVFDYISYL